MEGAVALSGYFAGKSNDSTFLSDASFGNSLLLPNEDLNAGYAKMDVSGSYAFHRRAVRRSRRRHAASLSRDRRRYGDGYSW